MDHSNVTTALELPGKKVVKNLGLVRGVTVRSRSILGSIGASLQTLTGGHISLYADLCEQTREESYQLMIQHAEAIGANAVIAVRYDANGIEDGVAEVLCYGTAVEVQ